MRTAPAILVRATPVAAAAYVAGYGWPMTVGALTGGWSVAAAGGIVAASLLAGFWLTAPLAASNRQSLENERARRQAKRARKPIGAKQRRVMHAKAGLQ